MRPFLLAGRLLCLCLLTFSVYGQDKTNALPPKVSPASFILPASGAIDSNSTAVILHDIGSTHFIGNQKGWLSYVFHRQKRVKILNKKSMGQATVVIRLYTDGDDRENLTDLDARTYNLEDGKLIETRLAKEDVFEELEDKHTILKKFTLPAVKEGSIIEYSYTIVSDFDFNLPPWEFQSEKAPCLWSEYNVAIPELLHYVFVRQGIHSFAIDKQKDGHEYYRVEQTSHDIMGIPGRSFDINANTVIRRWVMKDVPTLAVENYLTTPQNYIDRIEFQLAQIYNGEETKDVMNTWAKATDELLKREDFGMPLEEDNEWLDPLLENVLKKTGEPLEEAREIYYYISRNFTCTDRYSKFIKTSLRNVVKKQGGNVGELNLLLVAMLRKRQIRAAPVLLSTREYGFNLAGYPMMDRLNYLICRAQIGGRDYWLDATRPGLGFGYLAENCYNGPARVISRKDSASVNFSPDSLKEKKVTTVFVQNSDKGGFDGFLSSSMDYPDSYTVRAKAWQSGLPGFFKDIQTSYGEDAVISDGHIDSLDKPEEPLVVSYNFHIKVEKGAGIIYYSPFMGETYRENPFSAAERKYPVEMAHTTDQTYILNMEVPEGYSVDELPKSARVSLNESEGLFEYLIAQNGKQIQMRSRIKLNKAEFLPGDYNTLRDFFAFIVRKQGEPIIFKKNK